MTASASQIIITAPAIIERDERGFWLWVPVCPICASREHVFGGGPLSGDPRRKLGIVPGDERPICINPARDDVTQYRLVEAAGLAAGLLRAADRERRRPFQILTRQGKVFSRHHSRETGMKALERARRLDPYATLLDVRLLALSEVLELMGQGEQELADSSEEQRKETRQRNDGEG